MIEVSNSEKKRLLACFRWWSLTFRTCILIKLLAIVYQESDGQCMMRVCVYYVISITGVDERTTDSGLGLIADMLMLTYKYQSMPMFEVWHWQTVRLWQWRTVLSVRLFTSPARTLVSRILLWITGDLYHNSSVWRVRQDDHCVCVPIITPPSLYAADTVYTDDDKQFLWLWTHSNWSSNGLQQTSEVTCRV